MLSHDPRRGDLCRGLKTLNKYNGFLRPHIPDVTCCFKAGDGNDGLELGDKCGIAKGCISDKSRYANTIIQLDEFVT